MTGDQMNKPPAIRQPWPKTRQCTRQPLEGRLTIHTAEGKVRGWLHDIGEEGVGGVVAVQVEPGSPVEVEFELASGAAPMRTTAIVRFSSGFRYGFQFDALAPEHRDAIRHYCASASAQASSNDMGTSEPGTKT
jgi:hypothetical protein